MKKVLAVTVTLGILFGATYGIAYITSTRMIDWAFFVGLLLSVIIYFFSSNGGIISNSVHLSVQSQTGIRQEIEKRRFIQSTPFYVSIAYTIVGLIAMLVAYWNKFW